MQAPAITDAETKKLGLTLETNDDFTHNMCYGIVNSAGYGTVHVVRYSCTNIIILSP